MNLEAEELGTVRDDCFENPSTLGRIRNGVLLEESVYEIGRFHTMTIPRQHHARPCPALCATRSPSPPLRLRFDLEERRRRTVTQ